MLTTILTCFVVLSLSQVAWGVRGVSAFWYRVAVCETGSGGVPRWNWGAEHRPGEGSTYEGGLGFYWATYRTWAAHLGLLTRYPHAYDAPPAVQARVAAYGLSVGGWWGSLHNGCAGS